MKLESVTPASAITLFRVPARSPAPIPSACPAAAMLAMFRCRAFSSVREPFATNSASLACSSANHASSFCRSTGLIVSTSSPYTLGEPSGLVPVAPDRVPESALYRESFLAAIVLSAPAPKMSSALRGSSAYTVPVISPAIISYLSICMCE